MSDETAWAGQRLDSALDGLDDVFVVSASIVLPLFLPNLIPRGGAEQRRDDPGTAAHEIRADTLPQQPVQSGTEEERWKY